MRQMYRFATASVRVLAAVYVLTFTHFFPGLCVSDHRRYWIIRHWLAIRVSLKILLTELGCRSDLACVVVLVLFVIEQVCKRWGSD